MAMHPEYTPLTVATSGQPGAPGGHPWLALMAAPFVWFIPLCLLTGVVAAFTGLIFLQSMVPAVVTPVLTCALVYFAYRFMMDFRHRNGQVIIGYVETAVRLNLPLLPFLQAALRSEQGRRARQLGRVCQAIQAGLPVGVALSAVDDVPTEVTQRVMAAERLGQLREALGRSLQKDRDEETGSNPDSVIYRFYMVYMLMLISNVILGIMVFVVPKFKEIFKDFKTNLPPLTQAVMGTSDFFAVDAWPLTMLLLLALYGGTLLLMSVFMSRLFMPSLQLPDFARIWRNVAWNIPGLRDVEVSRGMTEVCGLLAESSRNGVPLPAALHQAIGLPMNDPMRGRVAHFGDLLSKGFPPTDAARNAGLPDLATGMLASHDTGSEHALFGFLARYYRGRFNHALILLRGLAEPVLVLCFAGLVGTVVVALFLPLVKLIQSVSGGDGGAL